MKYCSYCICVAFIVAFFDSFRACFFVVQMSRVHQFCACSFSGFLRLSFVFSLCFYLCTFISYCAPLDSPKFLPIILSDHPDYPCQLPDFSCCHQTLQKRLLLAHFGGFLPCFCFPLCPVIYSHSTKPIYTHLHSFLSFFCQTTKNMMSGEISPATGPKSCAAQPFFFMLALFLCPPVPLYYIAPIRAHPHPFTPICDPPQP